MATIKSFQEQLQDALDANDLEKAKIIVEAMKAANKPVKKKKPAKKKPVAKKPKAAKKGVKAKQVELPRFDLDYDEPEDEPKKLIIPTEDEILDLTDYGDDDDDDEDVEDFTTNTRPKARRKGTKPGDTPCRQEPINVKNRKMEFFNGNKKEGDAIEDSIKVNKALAKMYAKADANRPVREKRKVQKAKVKCYACGKIEIVTIDLAPNVAKGEGYKCNDCVTSQGE